MKKILSEQVTLSCDLRKQGRHTQVQDGGFQADDTASAMLHTEDKFGLFLKLTEVPCSWCLMNKRRQEMGWWHITQSFVGRPVKEI